MGIDFFNLAGIKYIPETMTLAGYFQNVKAHIRANTACPGQIIQHNKMRHKLLMKHSDPVFKTTYYTT